MQDDLTSAVKSIFRQLLSACCSATLLSGGESGSGCSAQVDESWDLLSTLMLGGKRELRESVARYEMLNCPLFHPTVGMEMAHVCQGGLGGMTSKLADVIGYEVMAALRR